MNGKSFSIANRLIGSEHPCFIIGEIAQAHDGSLGCAHAFIDAIANAGADAIKFQAHIAHAESSKFEPFRVKFSQQDKTRYDYWQRMEFTEEQWKGLADHANERGLIFLSSPFSGEAIDLLQRVGMPAWKVASGEVNNPFILEKMISASKETGAPILISSGMSSLEELDAAIEHVQASEIPVGVFQCTSKYPLAPEELGLNMIQAFQERYGVPIGLSDHSGNIYAGLAAATLGASMIEVHVTLSREMFGPDVPVSLTTGELKQLVDGVRFIEAAINNDVEKDMMAKDFVTMRETFGKALIVKCDLPEGHRIERIDLSDRKPGSEGIEVSRMDEVIGRRLNRAFKKGEFIKFADLKGLDDV